jgi:hypothetical protein
MDQIVAQSQTQYGKITGMKRKEAAVIIKTSEKKISLPTHIIATNGNGKGNGNGKVLPTVG